MPPADARPSSQPLRSDVLDAMTRAAHLAGDSLRRDVQRLDTIEIREKKASDFVSSADLRSQAIIRAELTAAFPDHGLLLEEGDDRAAVQGRRFIVDPLDGTTNFLHGIPHFAVCIALEDSGEIVSGLVLDVMRGELFVAEKGRGAWLGDRRLSVSRETDLKRAIVSTGIPHRGRGDHEPFLESLRQVMLEVAGVRRLGAAALDLAYVAAGRCEAFFETGLAPWDVAAGSLLVREAGGVVSQTDGRVVHLSGDVLASSSEHVHASMLPWVAPLQAFG